MYLLYQKNPTWRWLRAIPTPRSEICPYHFNDCATSELSMRAWKWNVTNSKKKLFLTWLLPDIFRYDSPKKCPTILYVVNLWLKPVSARKCPDPLLVRVKGNALNNPQSTHPQVIICTSFILSTVWTVSFFKYTIDWSSVDRWSSQHSSRVKPQTSHIHGVNNLRQEGRQIGRYADWQLCRQAGMQTGKYADIQICRQAGMQTGRYADRTVYRQACRQAGMQTGRYADIQVCRQAGMQTGRYTGRYADRQVCRQAGMQTGMQTGRYVDRQVCRQAGMQTGRYAGRYADRQVCRQAGMQIYRYADRQVCRQAGMQKDRQADRQAGGRLLWGKPNRL